MSEVRTIKDVDDDAWSSFKSIAAKNNMNMGKMFERLVYDYKENSEKFWDDILNPGYIISEKEAKYFEETVKKIREDHGFRK